MHGTWWIFSAWRDQVQHLMCSVLLHGPGALGEVVGVYNSELQPEACPKTEKHRSMTELIAFGPHPGV
eukprot:4680087-Amphidinium_carterae.2